MMNWNKNRNLILILAIAVLSFLLRFCGLGTSALVSNEAELALNAQTLYAMQGSAASGQLLYLLPTAWIFKAIGSSTAAARLFPALMGFLLTLLPLFLRKKLGYPKTLLLCALLTVDPVLLFWSKRADAIMPTITLMTAGLVFLFSGHRRFGTVLFMLAVCGGERFWPLLISAGFGFLLWMVLQKREENGRVYPFGNFRKEDIRLGLLILLLFSTGLGTFPAGLGVLGTGLANSLRLSPDWARPGWLAILIALMKYCGIPLLLLCIGCFRKRTALPMIACTTAFALLLLWQGVMGLPFVNLCLLSGWVIGLLPSVMMARPLRVDFSFSVSMSAVPALFSFLWFRLIELVNQGQNHQSATIHWNNSDYQLPVSNFTASLILTLLCIIILALIIKILLGFFGTASVKQGALCGLLCVIAWGTVQNCWSAAGFSRTGERPMRAQRENSVSLLNGNYATLRDSALREVLQESVIKRGKRDNCVITCYSEDPLLYWELQEQGLDFLRVQHASGIDWAHTDILLVPDENSSSYEKKGLVKTTFPYAEGIHWKDFTFADWGKWLITEKAAAVPAAIDVWVKNSYIYIERSE